MLCDPQLSGWAADILTNLGDTSTPTGNVVLWLKTNLGKLNLALNTEFGLNDSGCVTGDWNLGQSGIYVEMYACAYYKKQAAVNAGAAEYDWTSIEGDEQGKIRKVSRNEVAKTYLTLSKECQENVKKMIIWYHNVYYPQYAKQVLYHERQDVAYSQYCIVAPPAFSNTNYIFING